jgi:hypothetical protein
MGVDVICVCPTDPSASAIERLPDPFVTTAVPVVGK